MTVRNEEKKPFRDLTPEEMGEIASAIVRGEVEYWSSFSRIWMTPVMAMGGIDLDAAYRTRPRKLVIPWKVIRKEVKWVVLSSRHGLQGITANKNGEIPEVGGFPIQDWNLPQGSSWVDLDCLNVPLEGVNWRESLTERPDGV